MTEEDRVRVFGDQWKARPIQGERFSESEHFEYVGDFAWRSYGIHVCGIDAGENSVTLYANDEIIALSPLDALRLVRMLQEAALDQLGACAYKPSR